MTEHAAPQHKSRAGMLIYNILVWSGGIFLIWWFFMGGGRHYHGRVAMTAKITIVAVFGFMMLIGFMLLIYGDKRTIHMIAARHMKKMTGPLEAEK